MESKPVLLWVDLSVKAGFEKPPALLERHCEIRCMEHGEIPCAADTEGHAKVIAFNYDYPDMPGLKLLTQTKQQYPSVPVLMFTLHHSERLAVWAFRAQVFDYFVKPLSRQEVDGCMSRLGKIIAAKQGQPARRRLETTSVQPPPEVRYQSLTPMQRRLQVALTYIHKHINETIREPEVADLCGMSHYHFSREFKAAFGASFQNYLVDYRIRAAKELLANPSVAIIDIGMSVGFNDPSYFARTFKRRTGISPSDYRRSVQERRADSPAQPDDSARIWKAS